MDERIQEMRLKLDKISWEPDQLEKNKQAFDFIVMYSDYLIQQVAQIESMAHVIKVKNKEMRELSNFLKERNIPLKELSPLITVMNQVQELERDRAEWEIESHTQNARNKRLEHQFNELYRKHFIKVDQLEKQNQRYKEVKGQLEAIYDAEDMENPIIKNEYIGGYLQGLDRAIDLLEYAQEGES
ncbi:hypothetical protein GCM10011346_53020 [Oceanobacillus neutriphilus]|uniref:Uncharacterized protein n=2 Tax=Oceanobacillus neutriphilus TaxID=531815 RepID=A0ABQ2P3K0_9BACI|nr:hypothetical protein GCM10011346_53020 [Oceanobacillus neutriphilus]